MKTPFSEIQGPAKVLAICAAIVFVGMGLCGLEWAVAGAMGGALGGRGQHMLPALVVLGLIEFVVVVVAGAVGFFVALYMIIRAISGRRV
jgi:hypothetical protein